MAAGTAHALSVAEPLLRDDRFLLINGDDIHGPEAFKEALLYPLAIIAATHEEPSRFGVIERNSDGTLASIVEKPEHPTSNLISTGTLLLDKRIFGYAVPQQPNGEYYLTDPLAQFAKDNSVMVIEQSLWLPLGCPEDIPLAERRLNPDLQAI
jgi:dTDP-glucose pyrophosphorylase